jgi:RNA recognition motif-containing protein
VEYATREQAQNAVNTLSNQNLMNRLVYVREDREPEPRFSGGPSRGDFGGPGRGGFGYGGGGGGAGGGGRQLYVSNLPFNVGWQDLKDLFRQAGKPRMSGFTLNSFNCSLPSTPIPQSTTLVQY